MTTVVEQIGPDARRWILECVYELFSTRAVRDVGIDEIVRRSGVAKATLYRHFPSKDALVVAFLQLREERWTYAFVEAGARGRGGEGEGALLAIFDVFDVWFRQDDFEACAFINVLLESARSTRPGGRAPSISRTSAGSSGRSPRRPGSGTPRGSRVRGTSS